MPQVQGYRQQKLRRRHRNQRSKPLPLRFLSVTLCFVLLALPRHSCARRLREDEETTETPTMGHEMTDESLPTEDSSTSTEGLLASASTSGAEVPLDISMLTDPGPSKLSPVLKTLHRIFPSNISGTYKGTWEVAENQTSLPLPDLKRRSGNIIFQIRATETGRREIHFLQGEVVLRDGMYISDGDVHMKLEGVYVRTWGELRMVLSSAVESDLDWSDAVGSTTTYPLGIQETNSVHAKVFDQGSLAEMSRRCRVRMIAHVSPTEWDWKTTFSDGVREHVPSEIQGLLESPWDGAAAERALERRRLLDQVEMELKKQAETHPAKSPEGQDLDEAGLELAFSDEAQKHEAANMESLERKRALIRSLNTKEDEDYEMGDHSPCFATLRINATAVDLDAFYNKAVNYTLLVTFVSFLQVLFIIRQMEHSNTQTGAAKVSMLMVGQQAIMDAYLCLLHLTAGIVVESLFNAFATAAFFKFVIFSIFEMRYLLAIWKARRPSSTADSWDVMRRELSVLYSRFYGFLLGGILLLYKFNSVLRYLLLIFYSFWIPQIVTSVIRDSRKPLHLYYILGISITRLAVPLYIFGCPRNFMRIEPNYHWCAALVAFMGFQVTILLLQHFFGPRCFIPRQFLPEKYCYFRRIECSSRLRESCGEQEEGCLPDCVICMAPVCATQCGKENMVTPCDHLFHARCLQRWMDIKMECPTCRRALPPL